jgi:hypothetical protein
MRHRHYIRRYKPKGFRHIMLETQQDYGSVNHGHKRSCPVLEVNGRYHIYIHNSQQNIINELNLTTIFDFISGKSKARTSLIRNDPRDAQFTTTPVTQHDISY